MSELRIDGVQWEYIITKTEVAVDALVRIAAALERIGACVVTQHEGVTFIRTKALPPYREQ